MNAERFRLILAACAIVATLALSYLAASNRYKLGGPIVIDGMTGELIDGASGEIIQRREKNRTNPLSVYPRPGIVLQE